MRGARLARGYLRDHCDAWSVERLVEWSGDSTFYGAVFDALFGVLLILVEPSWEMEFV